MHDLQIFVSGVEPLNVPWPRNRDQQGRVLVYGGMVNETLQRGALDKFLHVFSVPTYERSHLTDRNLAYILSSKYLQ